MLETETVWKLSSSGPGTRRTLVERDLKPDHGLTKTVIHMHTSWLPSSVLPLIVLELLFKQERQFSRPVAFLDWPHWNKLLSCFTTIFISVNWTLGMTGGQIWSIKTIWGRLLAEDSDNVVKIFCAWAVIKHWYFHRGSWEAYSTILLCSSPWVIETVRHFLTVKTLALSFLPSVYHSLSSNLPQIPVRQIVSRQWMRGGHRIPQIMQQV